MPAENRHLPHTRVGRHGRIAYFRRIPTKLRRFMGGKASFARELGGTAEDLKDPKLLSRYARINEDCEAAFARAIAEYEADQADLAPIQAVRPLSRRDHAGIAAEPFRQLLDSVNKGETALQKQVMARLLEIYSQLSLLIGGFGERSEIESGFAGLPEADQTKAAAYISQLKALLALPVLSQLDPATSVDLAQLSRLMRGYVADAADDLEKQAQGDFSLGALAAKAPPMPKRKRDWPELLALWQKQHGGILEVDGYGVAQAGIDPYRSLLRELEQVLPGIGPEEINRDECRVYIQWLQHKSGLAIRTQQGRVTCLLTLLKIATKEDWISTNPAAGLQIKLPKGLSTATGYRALTKEELQKIFAVLSRDVLPQYRIGFELLLLTGARLDEVRTLRCRDIKQTVSGLWFIDWRHEPIADLPIKLKSGVSNERQFPVPQRILKRLLDQVGTGRVWGELGTGSAWSVKFKNVLRQLEIWEPRRTCVHSLRNSFIDLAREAGVPWDVRHAATGHAAKSQQDQSYGEGLKRMPERLNEELIKIDWSWLDQSTKK